MDGSNPCREAAIAMLSSAAAAAADAVEVDEDIHCMRLRLRDIEGRSASLLAAKLVPTISFVEYASGLNAKQAAGGASRRSSSGHFIMLPRALMKNELPCPAAACEPRETPGYPPPYSFVAHNHLSRGQFFGTANARSRRE